MSAKQPHRKRVKHFHRPGDLHELTFSCYRRKPLLTNDDWCCRLARSIDAAANKLGVLLVAFVFMPEHVHLLVFPQLPQTESGDVDLFLSRLKQPFSKQIHQLLAESKSPLLDQLMVRERPGKTCFRFWQEGPGFDRNLYSPEAIQKSIDYIHNNPVQRGLCEQAIDWKWSSARYYLLSGLAVHPRPSRGCPGPRSRAVTVSNHVHRVRSQPSVQHTEPIQHSQN